MSKRAAPEPESPFSITLLSQDRPYLVGKFKKTEDCKSNTTPHAKHVMQGVFRGPCGETIELYGEGDTYERARNAIGCDLHMAVNDPDEYDSGNAFINHCLSVELEPGPSASYALWLAIKDAVQSITHTTIENSAKSAEPEAPLPCDQKDERETGPILMTANEITASKIPFSYPQSYNQFAAEYTASNKDEDARDLVAGDKSAKPSESKDVTPTDEAEAEEQPEKHQKLDEYVEETADRIMTRVWKQLLVERPRNPVVQFASRFEDLKTLWRHSFPNTQLYIHLKMPPPKWNAEEARDALEKGYILFLCGRYIGADFINDERYKKKDPSMFEGYDKQPGCGPQYAKRLLGW